MKAYRFKRHATENVDEPDRTLCGETILARSALIINNADPNCLRCMRVIDARYRSESRG